MISPSLQYLKYLPGACEDEISALHSQRHQWAGQNKKGFLRYREPAEELARFHAGKLEFSHDIVQIGTADEVSAKDQRHIHALLKQFMPWRKGPFSVFGVEIDAEWRSEQKWARLAPHLPDLENRVIADIGCNNGYYMFRMAAHRPKFVLGFEPTIQHYYCFQALNGMARQTQLEVDLFGVEHLALFPNCFDLIFLMGIIYHRPSPIDTLLDINKALKPGGMLILESQTIAGDEPYALFPASTYAKVPGTYFVPTGNCLLNWINKCGFVNAELFSNHPMSSEEQRRTEWMTFESYSDFILPDDPNRTVEGYPAPQRVLIKCWKKT